MVARVSVLDLAIAPHGPGSTPKAVG